MTIADAPLVAVIVLNVLAALYTYRDNRRIDRALKARVSELEDRLSKLEKGHTAYEE
ncbi:MAG: hypothetical protein KJ065_26855 [Anaerolineae bacterium]|nr:hypothetical protein [Anaerolineae bacterium]